MDSSNILDILRHFRNYQNVRGLLTSAQPRTQQHLDFEYNLHYAANVVLAIYGIYRPEDNDTITLIDNEDIPGLFKLFFEYIEVLYA